VIAPGVRSNSCRHLGQEDSDQVRDHFPHEGMLSPRLSSRVTFESVLKREAKARSRKRLESRSSESLVNVLRDSDEGLGFGWMTALGHLNRCSTVSERTQEGGAARIKLHLQSSIFVWCTRVGYLLQCTYQNRA
jgi:hypothetical protein